MESPFKFIPEKFFSPLASRNREHYAKALLLFYDSFLESPGGVDREGFIDMLESYCEKLPGIDLDDENETSDDSFEAYSGARGKALLLLRKIRDAGWVSEETLSDFSRIINLSSYAKPFFEALHIVASGGGTEYESHIVAVYSLLCSDASADNGHYIVLRAHDHVMKLLDSLKVLSQNIKSHFETLFSHNDEIKDILNAHYNIYIEEIIDRAYNRLKTSDNLSRYRPDIISKINEYLEDEEWLAVTAGRLLSIRIKPGIPPRDDLVTMLEEMRDNLRNMDHIIDDIDRRNRMYSRISTEKIKNRLYADSTMGGKLVAIAGAIAGGELDFRQCEHSIFRFRSLSSESCYSRFKGDKSEISLTSIAEIDYIKLSEIERDLRRRITLQLNAVKITDFLNEKCGQNGITDAHEIVSTVNDYVKIMYSGVYSSAHGKKFPFGIDWRPGILATSDGSFEFQSHGFYRRAIEKKRDD